MKQILKYGFWLMFAVLCFTVAVGKAKASPNETVYAASGVCFIRQSQPHPAKKAGEHFGRFHTTPAYGAVEPETAKAKTDKGTFSQIVFHLRPLAQNHDLRPTPHLCSSVRASRIYYIYGLRKILI